MTASELLTLIDAGFTVEDLRPMLGGSAPADDPAPEASEEDPAQEEQPDQPSTSDRLDKIEDLISQMASAIIKGTEAQDPNEERDNGLKGLLEGM